MMEDFDYKYLSKDDKEWAMFFEYCLLNPDEKIQMASQAMAELAYDIVDNMGTPNEVSREEVKRRKQEIYMGLSETEIALMEQFGLAYMNQLDIEREKEEGKGGRR